ncbi:nuclear receptor-interacting protein 1 [Hypanus sabinus]|uniref:nuclear receptor-interacting protein 1 n=1 Tax=Hypanus sabinus TaxID=79690 RepID=UPI0028C450E9|nr:nuclear receptor-interacting protein 1 [Hypanus sabinus]XP_059824948.1 nuclear receptor-interacting protein 1 [Hypanus sabinus]XP_059824949.1 nuclear receptor-interacting protein 1 [Hypanus sabinus]XP_059824950.1 nuclear receptor-interacting protein 1 [Hypanus sabinus]XP_059824951.1 nuclear receptor-interacting protein 1 [Hypanus sabinus]XP_059824952.1 nuclear receptor-interacting protein 1 [Hypanus sabinus]XP_059824953.1 nuclear receptor-interacting protein 1 [Hypanus sabinus]XP_05982495
MTHGEELSSEMHQDSVVLTYLESVLMHRAAVASAAGSPGKSGPEGSAHPGRGAEGALDTAPIPGRPPAPSPPRAARTGPALNVKKARLLQGEAWDGAKRRKISGQESKSPERPQQQTHSTLLASLLQSFGSGVQDHQQHGVSPGSRASSPEEEEEEPGACGRLAALLDDGKNEEPQRESPPIPGAQRLSCSARLKAVASMVGKGPSAPSSPKPSAACSQLALLLSSDCQLQQYSRARSLAPSASQRLAAIASKKLAGVPPPERPAVKGPASVPRDRASRSPASPATGSSLLKHLLNSPKLPAANGHAWAAAGEVGSRPGSHPPAGGRPSREGGEEERGGIGRRVEPEARSNCTPMDLSTKGRVSSAEPASLQPGTLEQMTESLLFSWNPKAPGLKGPEPKVDEEGTERKSHQKVTLLQLLLGHHQPGSRTPEPGGEAATARSRRPSQREPFPSPAPSLAERSTSLKPRGSLGARRGQPASPADCPSHTLPLHADSAARPRPKPGDLGKAQRFLPERPVASESPLAAPFPKQLFPLELRQSSPCAPAPVLAGDGRLSNFSFSASKLLHDLARTGSHRSPEPMHLEPELRASLEPKVAKEGGGRPLGFQRSDPGAGHERRAGRAGDLERRSVLQLLLRSTEKERGQPRARRSEQPAAPDSLGEADTVSIVKVKTEPSEDDDGRTPFYKVEESPECQRRTSGTPLLLENLKQEVRSPQSPSPLMSSSHARGGVLSQLLRHSSGPPHGYLSSGPASLEASATPSNPCPGLRHLLPSSPADRRDLQKMPERPVAINGHAFYSNGLSAAEAGCKPQERGPGHGGAEAGPRSYLKDTQGFNVLKQLLLSENGIKALSDHRTLQNGGSARDLGEPKAPGGAPAQYYRERDLRRGGKESPVQPPRYPGTARLPQPQRGTHPEPPWLTKANPILYYMLQRGGDEVQPRANEGDAFRKDRKRHQPRSNAESQAGPCWVKEEPEEPLACFGSLRVPPPPSPGQIMEKVAAIKREPD